MLIKKMLSYVFIIFCFSTLFLRGIDLTNSDIGRHIINGKLFVTEKKILKSNYYSYTEPSYEFVNHHWFSGVIFFLIYNGFGFEGLSIFSALFSGLSIFLIFITLKKGYGTHFSLLTLFITVPIIIGRAEIRPEIFSNLLLIIYFIVLESNRQKKMSLFKVALLLIPLQVLWVNLHIYFIFGLCLVGAYMLGKAIREFQNKQKISFDYALLLICLVVASMANPFFIKGLLEPFNIFRGYNYVVYENISLLSAVIRDLNELYHYAFFIGFIYFALIFNKLVKKESYLNFELAMITTAFFILSLLLIRALPLFAYFFSFVFITPLYLHLKKYEKIIRYVVICTLVFLPFVMFSNGVRIGLKKDNLKAAEFYKQNNISGVVFNNYDIGGYLIFNNIPVFIDNRPEAYSPEFLETSVKMYSNDDIWKSIEESYNISTIFMRHSLYSKSVGKFIQNRLQENQWVAVYFDEYNVILVKNIPQNQEIIEKYKITSLNL